MRSPDQVAGMLCPVCKVPLSLSDRSGIEIDYCPQCRGVWLDRGELDRIIERDPGSAPPQRSAPQAQPPQYSQPHYAPPPAYGYGPGHGHYKHKRKKHWLEEIFD